MTKIRLTLCFLAAALAGCASSSMELDHEDGAVPASVEPLDLSPSGVDVQTSAQGPPTARPPGRAQDLELSIWRDPGFRRRLAESYLAVSDVEPSVSVAEREKLLPILDLISADRAGEAAALLQAARGPKASAVFDFTLATIFLQNESFAEAVKVYRVAVDKFPKFRRAWRQLGVSQVRLNDFPGAIEAMTRVIELGGGDAVTYGILGHAYSNVGDALAAESSYRMAILLDPGTRDWKLGLAHSLFEQQRFGDAVALFDTLIEKDPDDPRLWLAQGEAYARLGQPMKAAQNFELVDRLGASTPGSLYNLADIYANQKLHDLAVRAYARALRADEGGKPDRAIRAAKFLSMSGALDPVAELIAVIDEVHGATLGDEEKKELLRLRARVAVASGRGEEEVEILKEIVRLDPLDGQALILLGQNAARHEETQEEAILYYERAANVPELEADAKVRHAQLLVSRGRYADALPLLRQAQSVKPRDNIQDYLERVERAAKSR